MIATALFLAWGPLVAHAALQPFTGITQIVSSGPALCLLDRSVGFSCFGDDSFTPALQAMTPAMTGVYLLGGGEGRFCAAHSAGVTCWNPVTPNPRPTETETISTVNSLAVGATNACAVTPQGVQCWGDPTTGMNAVPASLTHPTSVAISGTSACAIQDNAYVCWGQGFGFGAWPPTTPRSQKLVTIQPYRTMYRNGFCAAGDQGIECFGSQDGYATLASGDFTQLTNGQYGLTADHRVLSVADPYSDPTQGTDGNYTALVADVGDIQQLVGDYCAASATQVKCYGDNIHVPVTPTNGVTTYTADGGRCAVDKDGIKCFGPEGAGPSAPFVAPAGIKRIVSDGQATCALTGGAPVCWGGLYWDPVRKDLTHVEEGFFFSQDYASGFCGMQDGHVLCAGRSTTTDGEENFELTNLAGFDHVFVSSSYGALYFGVKGNQVTCFIQGSDGQIYNSQVSLPATPTWVESLEGFVGCTIRSLVGSTLRVDTFSSYGIQSMQIPDVREGKIHQNITNESTNLTAYAAYITTEGQLVCSVYDLGAGTKTGDLKCPALTAPQKIQAQLDGFCAIDQGSLVCWSYTADSAHSLTVKNY